MNAKQAIWVLAVSVAMCGICSDGTAWGTMDAGTGYFFASSYVSPGVYGGENLPYYALFPPVYYSYPVRAPYGTSPFAQVPYPYAGYGYTGVDSCAAAAPSPVAPSPSPKLVKNPYVLSGDPVETPVVAQSAPKPLRIVNPFVAGASGSGSSAASRPTVLPTSVATVSPQVDYPAALAR